MANIKFIYVQQSLSTIYKGEILKLLLIRFNICNFLLLLCMTLDISLSAQLLTEMFSSIILSRLITINHMKWQLTST